METCYVENCRQHPVMKSVSAPVMALSSCQELGFLPSSGFAQQFREKSPKRSSVLIRRKKVKKRW
jgi:hypothetical protein